MRVFQMLTVDLMAVTGLLFTIALSDVLPSERMWTDGLSLLFLAWGVAWELLNNAGFLSLAGVCDRRVVCADVGYADRMNLHSC